MFKVVLQVDTSCVNNAKDQSLIQQSKYFWKKQQHLKPWFFSAVRFKNLEHVCILVLQLSRKSSRIAFEKKTNISMVNVNLKVYLNFPREYG